MVITARKLELEMGINSEIAHYFANERKVPVENAYWKDKRIYISFGFGYKVIPFLYDLLHRCGISKEILLSDEHVTMMELGFDKVGRYEKNEIAFHEFLSQCELLLAGKIKQHNLASDLFAVLSNRDTKYFQFETKHKALARSDSFLFTLVDLDVSDEWVVNFLPIWYSLVRPILLLDDFKDLEDDRVNQEENMILELGDDENAVRQAYEFAMQDLAVLGKINPKLSVYIEGFFKKILTLEHIRSKLS